MILIDQYVPILKSKAGEFKCLANLNSEFKDIIVPIFDIVPKPLKKTTDKHIDTILNYIKKNWESSRRLYIDGYMIQEYGNLLIGKHPMEFIFDQLRALNYNAIPVINSNTGSEYNEIIKNIINIDKKGICIRIFRESFKELNTIIEQLLSFISLDPTSVDLLLDLRSLENCETNNIYNEIINILNNICFKTEWRSLILSGSSFPIDLVEFKPDQIHLIYRKEWEVWKKILQNNEVERLPIYSDYAISHPLLSQTDTEIPNASASIRYTHFKEYYLYRGKGLRQHHHQQFFDLSEALINSQEYFGENHCLGDKFIYKCGTEKKKPGSLTTWRWVGTNHHLTVVVEQLRQFFLDLRASRTS